MATSEEWTTAAHSLLENATRKLLELRSQPDWRHELPSRCPPILWFGNARATKPLIVTVGANPSRQEYLADARSTAIDKVRSTGNESMLSWLEPPLNRFRLLKRTESLDDLLTSEVLRHDIIEGYNRYFARNPYSRWFGQRVAPYNVEAFLQGAGASYYDGHPARFQAVHIDLFPFATLDDFKSLQRQTERDLFRTRWAQGFMLELLTLLQPRALVIFGKTNFELFGKYHDARARQFDWTQHGAGRFCYGRTSASDSLVIGLSTNLGNPIGFDKQGLREFGARVARASGLISVA
jgi:hypothetical protein